MIEQGLEGLHDPQDVLGAVGARGLDQGPLVHAVGHLGRVELQVRAILRILQKENGIYANVQQVWSLT